MYTIPVISFSIEQDTKPYKIQYGNIEVEYVLSTPIKSSVRL